MLFDEIEKAHPDVFNVLLQILDDGRVTDNQGRTVNFKDTIIIMTSNIGAAPPLASRHRPRRATISPSRARRQLERDLKAHFRPEFLNRVDDTIIFKPLTQTEVESIVTLLVEGLSRRPADRQIDADDRRAGQGVHRSQAAYDPVVRGPTAEAVYSA